MKTVIDDIHKLEAIYDGPTPPAAKIVEQTRIIEPYNKFVESCPFFVLATVGPEGTDCSARGDPPGFIKVIDPKTIVFPDRKGNNKIDSLRNIVRDPRVSILFLFPGLGTIFRVNGTASISIAPHLLELFADPILPKTVVSVKVDLAFMQCPRAMIKSRIWDQSTFLDPGSVPSVPDIVKFINSFTK